MCQLCNGGRPESGSDPEDDILLLLQRTQRARNVGASGRAAIHFAEIFVARDRFSGSGNQFRRFRCDRVRAGDRATVSVQRVQTVVTCVTIDLKTKINICYLFSYFVNFVFSLLQLENINFWLFDFVIQHRLKTLALQSPITSIGLKSSIDL
jgi:hypothetical protein